MEEEPAPPATEGQRLRRAFLENLDPERHFFLLFDHLTDVLFFAKDREGHLLAANRGLLDLYGYTEESDFWGVTDFELLPPSLAEKFRRDDLRVIESGLPMLEIVEIFVNRQGIPSWFLTNKLPVFSRAGAVIGVMGTIQPYASLRANLPDDLDLSRALAHVQEHFHEEISVVHLAGLVGLSVRQFERRFKQHLKTTPQEFIIKMRGYNACELLRKSQRSLGEIALDCGFYDQSSFTRQFRKHMGMTPLRYRKQYR